MNKLWILCQLVCLLLVVPTGLAAVLADPEIHIDHEQDDLVIDIRYQLPVNQRVAWDVLTDFEGMASFLPNMQSSRIIKREGLQWLVEQKGQFSIGGLKFSYDSTRQIELQPMHTLRAHALTGMHMDSTVTLTPNSSGTLLTYHAVAVPDLPLPNSLIASRLRAALGEQFKAMEQEMEARNMLQPDSPEQQAESVAKPVAAGNAPAAQSVVAKVPRKLRGSGIKPGVQQTTKRRS